MSLTSPGQLHPRNLACASHNPLPSTDRHPSTKNRHCAVKMVIILPWPRPPPPKHKEGGGTLCGINTLARVDDYRICSKPPNLQTSNPLPRPSQRPSSVSSYHDRISNKGQNINTNIYSSAISSSNPMPSSALNSAPLPLPLPLSLSLFWGYIRLPKTHGERQLNPCPHGEQDASLPMPTPCNVVEKKSRKSKREKASNKAKKREDKMDNSKKMPAVVVVVVAGMAANPDLAVRYYRECDLSSPYIIFLAAAVRRNGAEETATPNHHRLMIRGRRAVV